MSWSMILSVKTRRRSAEGRRVVRVTGSTKKSSRPVKHEGVEGEVDILELVNSRKLNLNRLSSERRRDGCER